MVIKQTTHTTQRTHNLETFSLKKKNCSKVWKYVLNIRATFDLGKVYRSEVGLEISIEQAHHGVKYDEPICVPKVSLNVKVIL